MIKAVIFDIGDVAVVPKYGKLYKRTMKKLDSLLGGFLGEEHPLRQRVQVQRRKHKVDPAVMDIIGELKAAGYLTPSITNSPGYRTIGDEALDKQETFKPLIASANEGIRKPDRRIYEIALRKIGLPADQCVFIDDKEENLVPAMEMGMKVILFKGARQLREDLGRLGLRFGDGKRSVRHG